MRAKLFGVCALAGALLCAAGVNSQPAPRGKDKGAAERVEIPAPGYGGLPAPDGDLSGFDLRQLVDELIRVRQERVALARREQALLALIPRRIEAQRKELDDLEKRLRDLPRAKDRQPEGKKKGG
jgi:hypothetical protein